MLNSSLPSKRSTSAGTGPCRPRLSRSLAPTWISFGRSTRRSSGSLEARGSAECAAASAPLPVRDSDAWLDACARVHTNRVAPKSKPLCQVDRYLLQLPPPLPRIRDCNAVEHGIAPDFHG